MNYYLDIYDEAEREFQTLGYTVFKTAPEQNVNSHGYWLAMQLDNEKTTYYYENGTARETTIDLNVIVGYPTTKYYDARDAKRFECISRVREALEGHYVAYDKVSFHYKYAESGLLEYSEGKGVVYISFTVTVHSF